MTRKKLYNALYDRYKARQSEALCNIQMYFREGVGVADHPNTVSYTHLTLPTNREV